MSNSIIGYNPFRAMDEFEKRMFREPFAPFNIANNASVFKTDIKEEEDRFVLEADLPGFEKDDIKLNVDNDILTISAERHSEHEDKDGAGKYIRCERSYGKYARSFDVSSIESEQIQASYENGVLKLEMPKKEALIPKKHAIELN